MITSAKSVRIEPAYVETKALGIKWLMFWNYFILPVNGIVGLLILPIILPLSILQLGVAYGLHYRRLWAWKWNWLLITVWFVGMSVPMPSHGSSGSAAELFALFILRFMMASVIWMWPNLVYWRKRKVLFTSQIA
jgi:hypothetical protein